MTNEQRDLFAECTIQAWSAGMSVGASNTMIAAALSEAFQLHGMSAHNADMLAAGAKKVFDKLRGHS